MLDRTQYEDFLTRAELVLGLDKTPATRQQWNVLAEGLYRLLEDRTLDQIIDEMIVPELQRFPETECNSACHRRS